MSAIVNNYYRRCVVGLIDNVNDIPPYWRNSVIELLKKNGYILNDDGTFVYG